MSAHVVWLKFLFLKLRISREKEPRRMDILESDSSSDEESLHINETYAEKYNKWRQKEELQKLKDKYGDVQEEDGEEDSSDESEDEDAEALTEQLETDWLKTLTALRRKDPRIYDNTTKFYKNSSDSDESQNVSTKKEKSKKKKPYLLKDYERDFIVQKGGKFSDDDTSDDNEATRKDLPKSYHEEQEEIRQSLKIALASNSDSDDEEILTKRKVTEADEEKEAEEYEEWLSKQKQATEKLAGVDPWDKPDLNEGEKFLKDFILNKKYVDDNDDDERVPTYDEIVNFQEEEADLEKQEHFERKYNFRYEEPDQEFIKSYPRTIGETVRRKDDRRIKKRQEAKERKQREKEKKREELKQLKNLKKREIMEKIDLIKEVTGNADIGFSPDDIDEDFDPEKYDKMMKKAFNEDYYEDNVDETKPVFMEDDEEWVENWDEWVPEAEADQMDQGNETTNGTGNDYYQNEDDWDSAEAETSTGSRKQNRRRKSRFAKAVSKRKPVFDPNDKTFEEYLDEYYKLDYEDMVGDQPCRFKYRSVVPNDFGLSTDDILTAKEKELNQWVSVKKMTQYRTKEEELLDVKIFQKKSKRKANVLLSVFEADNEKSETRDGNPKKKPKRQTNDRPRTSKTAAVGLEKSAPTGGFIKTKKLIPDTEQNKDAQSSGSKTDKNKRRKNKGRQKKQAGMSDERLKAYGINPKKFKYTKNRHLTPKD